MLGQQSSYRRLSIIDQNTAGQLADAEWCSMLSLKVAPLARTLTGRGSMR